MENDFFEQLLNKTDLVKLISRYVPLTKKGNTWWGCCPFHIEKTPSFSVSESKGLYHCFGCKASGNAITFLKNIESIETMDAVKILAEEAKMTIPQNTSGGKSVAEKELVQKQRDKIAAINKEAARHYHENLMSQSGSVALKYLIDRGIDQNLIRRFGLGYSVSGSEMLDYLEKLGFTKAEMKLAGIAEQKADEYYDVFYKRIIVPIINGFNIVIGFGGRTLEKNPEFAKYRNTSNTPLFDKSKNIFAINLVKKKKMQQEKINYIIMTEGYMDVIALHKAGFDTAVASMGTALTEGQAKLLKNYVDRVFISYDGDTAGQKATMRGLDILKNAGLNVRVVKLPEGLDPDDVIRKQGAAAYSKLLDEAVPLAKFKIETLFKNVSDEEQKIQATLSAIKVVKSLPSIVEQTEYYKIIQKYSGYDLPTIYRQADVELGESEEDKPKVTIKPENKTRTETAQFFILTSLINRRDYADLSGDYFSLFEDGFALKVYSFIIEKLKSNAAISSIFNIVSEDEKDRLKELLDYTFVQGDDEQKFNECVNLLKKEKLIKEKEELNKMFIESRDYNYLKKLQLIDAKISELKLRD